MISSMSQSGTFIPQEVLQSNLNEKDIKKVQKEIRNEIKEEIKEKKKDLMLKKKEDIKCSILEGNKKIYNQFKVFVLFWKSVYSQRSS